MSEARQFCTFFVDGLFFGVELRKVQELIRYQKITRVPLASPVVRGLINLRGQIITAIDLRRRLDLNERPADQLSMNVVVRTSDGVVSLLVDEIEDIVEVEEDTFEPPPETLKGVARELIRGAYKLKNRLLLVLDSEKAVDLAKGNRPAPSGQAEEKPPPNGETQRPDPGWARRDQ